MDWDAAAEARAGAAAEAAKNGGTAQGAMIMKELAGMTTQLSHRQLQFAIANEALLGLKACEDQAKKCVLLLVEALTTQQTGDELATDAMWTLNKLTRHCKSTIAWLMEYGGVAAIRRALETYPENRNLVLCSVWTTYTLHGLLGLASLLGYAGPNSNPSPPLGDNVVSATIWVIFELRSEDYRKGNEPPPEAELLLRLIVEVVRMRQHHEDSLRACCFAIEVLIRDEPKFGALLVQLGGAPLILQALHKAVEANNQDDELARICADALASLAQGAAAGAARALCQQSGAPEILVGIATRGQDSAAERAMVALGYLAGLGAVLQAMARAPASRAVIRGGLEAVSRLADKPSDEEEVRQLPVILASLLTLGTQMDGEAPVRCRHKCAAAVCATIRGLAPFAEPGQVPDLDKAVVNLLHSIVAEQATEVVEIHLECLGRVALLKESWRRALQSREAPRIAAGIIERFHQQRGQRKLMKYSFWFAAALSGISFVASQLQANMGSSEVVDAAFCTVIDILDDDIEGDWVLTQTERCSEADVPAILALIISAMGGHLHDAVLQSRGCHCIGLLLPLAPPSDILARSVSSVLAAARQHPKSADVARDCCYALRATLQPASKNGVVHQQEVVAARLRDLQTEDVVQSALSDFAHADEPGLLEDAVVVFAALSGIEAVLKTLVNAGPGPVRASGTKALFEYGRQHPRLLRENAQNVLATSQMMLAEGGGDWTLQQNVELLVGFCNACATGPAGL